MNGPGKVRLPYLEHVPEDEVVGVLCLVIAAEVGSLMLPPVSMPMLEEDAKRPSIDLLDSMETERCWIAVVADRSVAERNSLGITLEVAGAGQDHDALNKAPHTDKPEREDPQEHREDNLDDADGGVAEVETVDAESAEEDAQQTSNDFGLRLRVAVGRVWHRRLLGHVRILALELLRSRGRLVLRGRGRVVLIVLGREIPCATTILTDWQHNCPVCRELHRVDFVRLSPLAAVTLLPSQTWHQSLASASVGAAR